MVTYIVAGWILMGLISCYANRERIDRRSEQMWIMIIAPGAFCVLLFDWFLNFLDGPAIGKKK